MLLEGKAEDGQPHRAMVQHGLPAGWEIAARMAAGDVPGMAGSASCRRPRRSLGQTIVMLQWWR